MFRNAFILLLWSALALAQNQVQITQGPKVEHADSTTAVIAWSTNASSGTIVKYGTDPANLTQTAAMPWGGFTHRVTLQNLKPNTTYYFQAISDHAQDSGTQAASDITQFQTAGPSGAGGATATTTPTPAGANSPAAPAAQVQVAAGPIPQHISETSADIWWETAQQVAVTVRYGTVPETLNRTAQESAKATSQQSHIAHIAGLQAGTTYYVALADQGGNQIASVQFRTHGANRASSGNDVEDGPVFEFISAREAVIAWSTAQKSSTVVRYGTDPGNLNQRAEGSWGGGAEPHRVQLTNLQPNTKYWFEIQSGQTETSTMAERSPRYPFQTVLNASAALRFNPR